VCGDAGDISPDEPMAAPLGSGTDGLPFSYYFVGKDGTSAYARPGGSDAESPVRELEPGWAIGVVEQRTAHGERWGRNPHGEWISLRDLGPAHPSLFKGEEVKDALDFAWVLSERAAVFAGPQVARAIGSHVRFERVGWHEQKGPMVRISPDGASAEWMLARDLSHPALSAPPDDVKKDEQGAAVERWIDVELASQTLVAYEGSRPVFATLVSTGRGPRGTDSATPPGVHRIWVKIAYSTMDNIERDDVDKHYSMADVPWVQFFDKAVGLHGTYWHRDFGRVKSHGCVNLAPLDARRLFGWTSPKLPAGWAAAYPTQLDKGTVVRVR